MDSEVRILRLRTGITVPCFHKPGRLESGSVQMPVMLLHAWGESWRCFDRLIPMLEPWPVFAPDLRGQGEADKPASGYSLMEMAEDVAALFEALDVPAAYVLGSSSGGYIAQQFAVMHPERVSALILIGSPMTLQGRPPFADEVDLLTDPMDEAWVRNSLSWFPVLHAVPSDYIEDRIRDGIMMPAHAWKAILRGLFSAVPPTETGKVEAPTLILWGAEDGILGREQQQTLSDRISGSELKVYEGTGHVVLWESPERVAQDVCSFLNLLESREG